MLDQLQQIDTSVIDELTAIKRDRETLAQRLSRLEAEREEVSDVVYERVRRDYQSQAGALAERAAPLKDGARREYAELRTLFESLQEAQQAAKLDQEELELRHRLGEYEEDELVRRRNDLDTRLKGLERDLAEVSEVRERFVDAFDSEEELAEPPEPGPPPEPTTPGPPEPTPVPPAAGETILLPGEEPGGGTPDTLDETVPAPPPEAAPEPSLDEVVPPPAFVPGEMAPGTESSGSTRLLALASLVPDEAVAGRDSFTVEPLTLIGRTARCQIRIDELSVSRQHAQISLTSDGYVLRDLGSENGTYVNGEGIEERLLTDGDRVQIGTLHFVFHAGSTGGG